MKNTLAVVVTASPFKIANPQQQGSSSQPVLAQIQNASGWLLSVSGLHGVITVQPFEAASLDVTEAVSLQVEPINLVYPIPNGYVTSAWMLKNEAPPQPDGPLTSAATLAAGQLSNSQVLLSPSPFQYNATGTQTFTVPPNTSTPISDILIAYTKMSGTAPALVSAVGHTTGIQYMNPQTMAAGQFLTFPFSSLLDPGGLDVTVTYLGTGAGGPGTFSVIGLIYPTTVHQYFGVANTQGPSAYTSSQTNNAVLIAVGSAIQQIRIWALWVSGANAISTAQGDVSIENSGNVMLNAAVAATTANNGSSESNSLAYPTGIVIGQGPVTLQFNCTVGRGGVAYSLDIP